MFFANNDFFVLDMANNHQGSLQHAEGIIDELAERLCIYDAKFVLKFQYRDIPSIVHERFADFPPNKHIPRFMSTALTDDQKLHLKRYAASKGFLTMCTPFDEVSARLVAEHEFDIIKVASCSATDWPLIEAVSEFDGPIVFSTGGLLENEIDRLVSFATHRALEFAIMHCVSIYPTRASDCNLRVISEMKERYPGVPIGWSTHESPTDFSQVQLAKALGATLFERHVGKAMPGVELNAYSSTPEQIQQWYLAAKAAAECLGSGVKSVNLQERSDLETLHRGVYLARDVKRGEILSSDDIKLAMPLLEGQMFAGEFKGGGEVCSDIKRGEPLLNTHVVFKPEGDIKILQHGLHQVKAMLNKARICLPVDFYSEFSHHYGVKNWRETGALLLTLIDKSYCKKLVIMLPGQHHPAHFHKIKSESFHVLSGDFNITINGIEMNLVPGQIVHVQPGVWHEFSSEKGCIVEEVSTESLKNDSVYRDPSINENNVRKTVVENWGRFTLFPN